MNFDKFLEDGTPRACRRSEYVGEAIKAGAEIEIIDFDTLLALLGITAEELENAPMPDIRYLLDPKYSRKYRTAG